jgi:hypothetical protein
MNEKKDEFIAVLIKNEDEFVMKLVENLSRANCEIIRDLLINTNEKLLSI